LREKLAAEFNKKRRLKQEYEERVAALTEELHFYKEVKLPEMRDLLASCQDQLREFEELNRKRNEVITKLESENSMLKECSQDYASQSARASINVGHQYFRELAQQAMVASEVSSTRNLQKRQVTDSRWGAEGPQTNGTVIYHDSVRSGDETLLDHRSGIFEDTGAPYQLVQPRTDSQARLQNESRLMSLVKEETRRLEQKQPFNSSSSSLAGSISQYDIKYQLK